MAPRLASSISTSPSGGCSSRDVAFPFAACLSALCALYALAPSDPSFRVAAGSPAARPYRAPAPLELSLAGLQALMEPRFVVPPLAFSWAALGERVLTAHFAARTAVAGLAGLAMYLLFATVMHALFPRVPVVNKKVRALFDLGRWDSDLSLGVLGIVCGSPIQQGFMVLKETFGVSLAYADVADGRFELPGGLVLEGWTWWAVSLPIYLVLFDLVFCELEPRTSACATARRRSAPLTSTRAAAAAAAASRQTGRTSSCTGGPSTGTSTPTTTPSGRRRRGAALPSTPSRTCSRA